MSGWPTSAGSGESVFVTARSATGLTVVVALAELLARLVSIAVEATLAVFVIEPWFCGVTLIETVALAPLSIVPREHVTVPDACEQLPWDGVAESNVTPAGSVSVSVTAGGARWARRC